MNLSDYKETKSYERYSIGRLNNIYVCKKTNPNGFFFYPISQQEHDTFDTWINDSQTLEEITSRKIKYIGYFYTNECKECND